jgi:FixJ family two-component response regulator
MSEHPSPPLTEDVAASRTVCVIDDDPSVRTAMRRLLHCTGLTVATFASAEEFLQQPDFAETTGCLVTDVHLGGMNGLELQVALGRRGHAIPIIMITGVADEETELEAIRLGAIAFLRKPFNVGALLDAVMTALNGTFSPADADNRTAVSRTAVRENAAIDR